MCCALIVLTHFCHLKVVQQKPWQWGALSGRITLQKYIWSHDVRKMAENHVSQSNHVLAWTAEDRKCSKWPRQGLGGLMGFHQIQSYQRLFLHNLCVIKFKDHQTEESGTLSFTTVRASTCMCAEDLQNITKEAKGLFFLPSPSPVQSLP